jgi:hypothetical protein
MLDSIIVISAEPEERQYGQDDDYQSHQIDQTVHFASPCSLTPIEFATSRFSTRSFGSVDDATEPA